MLLELIVAMTLSGQVETIDGDGGARPPSPSSSQPCPSGLMTRTPVIDNSFEPENMAKGYMKEIKYEVGCPYYMFADYLLRCRPEKRQSAWKRIVRENYLFFDKKNVRQFEAISRDFSIL